MLSVSAPPASGPVATAPDPHRRPALAAVEGRGEQRERGGEHRRSADALHRARKVQHQRAGRQRAAQRREGEDPQPDDEDVTPPDAVGGRAPREQQRGQGQRVGVDHPLQVAEGRIQRLGDVGQGDIHDRDVDQQHERRHAHRCERPPLVIFDVSGRHHARP
jgi:hypothetical protein